MKYKLLFLVLNLLAISLSGQNRFDKGGISLSIHESFDNKEILVFTFKNKGLDTLITSNFDESKLNRVIIYSPLGEKVSFDIISCGDNGHLYLKPGEQKIWENNIGARLNPYVTRVPLPKGQYEVYWIVNDVQSASFFYEKLYDGVRW